MPLPLHRLLTIACRWDSLGCAHEGGDLGMQGFLPRRRAYAQLAIHLALKYHCSLSCAASGTSSAKQDQNRLRTVND